MIINDTRGKAKELHFENLEAGKVYVSHRLQKYVFCSSHGVVCLVSGDLFDFDECLGDIFTEVNARLEIY